MADDDLGRSIHQLVELLDLLLLLIRHSGLLDSLRVNETKSAPDPVIRSSNGL